MIYPSREEEIIGRGISPFLVRGRDRRGKTCLRIRGGTKVGDRKRGLGVFPVGGKIRVFPGSWERGGRCLSVIWNEAIDRGEV